MQKFPHAVVWIDHAQARVIHFDTEQSSLHVIHPRGGTPHLHHKANSRDDGHVGEDQRYLHEVSGHLRGAASILLTGPANCKIELHKHLEKHDPPVAACISAVRTVDHPSDGQLLDLARRHFGLLELRA